MVLSYENLKQPFFHEFSIPLSINNAFIYFTKQTGNVPVTITTGDNKYMNGRGPKSFNDSPEDNNQLNTIQVHDELPGIFSQILINVKAKQLNYKRSWYIKRMNNFNYIFLPQNIISNQNIKQPK